MIAVMIFLQGVDAWAQTPAAPAAARTTASETLKERLSDKASDEQRVDNCKVPKERRGTKPRPDGCAAATKDGTSAAR